MFPTHIRTRSLVWQHPWANNEGKWQCLNEKSLPITENHCQQINVIEHNFLKDMKLEAYGQDGGISKHST